MKFKNAVKFEVVKAVNEGRDGWAIRCIGQPVSRWEGWFFDKQGDAIRECKRVNRLTPPFIKEELRSISEKFHKSKIPRIDEQIEG